MNRKHKKTLTAIFAHPTRSDIQWSDIEALFTALGANVTEGAGSRVRVRLADLSATFHRPHPQKETKPYAARDVRDFMADAGIRPEGD